MNQLIKNLIVQTTILSIFLLSTTSAATYPYDEPLPVNNRTGELPFPDQTNFFIRTNVAATLVFSRLNTLPKALPTGTITTIDMSGSIGWRISITPNSSFVTNFRLTSPPLDNSYITMLQQSSHNQLCFFKYDANTESYGLFPADFESSSRAAFTIPNFMGTGDIFLGIFNKTFPQPVLFGQPAQIRGGKHHTIQLPRGLTLRMLLPSENKIKVYSRGNPGGDPKKMTNVANQFFEVEMLMEDRVNSTLEFSYNEDAVKSLKLSENSLRWGYFDDGSKSWQFPLEGGSVNNQTNVVYQSTDHFSVWTVYGTSDASYSLPVPLLSVFMIAFATLFWK